MIRDKIWYEIADIKYGEVYLALYLNRCRSQRRAFKIITLIFSAGGVFGWSIWEPLAVIACLIIAAIQILVLIEGQIVRSDEDMLKIGQLRELYVKYLNRLEKIWVDFESNNITDSEASDAYFKLVDQMKSKIETKDNELYINSGIKSLLKEAHHEHLNYLNNRYGKGS